MDNADIRRGRPAVHRKWNAGTAILSGPADKLQTVLRLFNDTAMQIYQGQQLDMEFEHRDDVTVNEYMKMIRLKTSVLLDVPAAWGPSSPVHPKKLAKTCTAMA